MKINLVTLCSGIEAQGQAMRRLCADYPELDWELLAWSEIDKDAIKAHNAIFPEYADRNLGDMTTCDYSKITEPVDVLFYSTPCQSVSVAGQNKGMKEGSDAASALIWHTRRAIESLKPKICILENVKGMIMGKNLKEFHKWCDVMESYGYTNYAKVLNSKDYGVPQNRERIFMLSIWGGQSYHFPEPFKLEKRIKDICEPYGSVDESFYFKPEQLLRIISHCDRKVEEGCGFKAQFHTEDEISGCVTTRYGQRETDPAIKEGISIHPLNRKMEFQGFNSIQSDVAPCLTAHDGRGGEPCLWQRLSIYGNNAQAGRVYDVEGIAPCLDTCCGGNRMTKILEPCILDYTRDDNGKVCDHHDKDIANTVHTSTGNGGNTDQFVKESAIIQRPHGFNDGGLFQEVAPTITTSSYQENNLLKEPQICSDPRKEFGRMDFSEISPTVVATDYKSPKIVREPMELSFENLPDKTVLKDEDGKGYLWQDGSLWRLRKLVPIEVGRLMGCSDSDIQKMIDAGISKTALYSLFGNSIVVDVLYHIFRKLWIDTENESAQKSLFDF